MPACSLTRMIPSNCCPPPAHCWNGRRCADNWGRRRTAKRKAWIGKSRRVNCSDITKKPWPSTDATPNKRVDTTKRYPGTFQGTFFGFPSITSCPCRPCRQPPVLSLSSGLSAMTASVVRNIAATEAAFCRAERVTFAGSTIPASIMLTHSPVAALKPMPTGFFLQPFDDDGAFQTGVVGDLTHRFFQRPHHDVDTGFFVAFALSRLPQRV